MLDMGVRTTVVVGEETHNIQKLDWSYLQGTGWSYLQSKSWSYLQSKSWSYLQVHVRAYFGAGEVIPKGLCVLTRKTQSL